MSSIVDDIRYGFIRRHGALGEIIAINTGLFVLTLLLNLGFYLSGLTGQGIRFETLLRNWVGLPAEGRVALERAWTLFTYQWFHSLGDLFHLLFNMLWLFWIGRLLREYQGDRKVWSVFWLGSIGAGLFFLLLENTVPVFRAEVANARALGGMSLIGASGGVTAIIVAAATLLPEYGIGLLLFGVVRLKWLALIMVALDVLFLPAGNAGGRLAHLGGALYGFLFITYLKRGVNLAAPYDWLIDTAKELLSPSPPKPKVRVVKNPNAGKGGTQRAAGAAQKPSQEEVDRILEKINRVGYDGLTKEEKQTLFNASR